MDVLDHRVANCSRWKNSTGFRRSAMFRGRRRPRGVGSLDYQRVFADAIERLHAEGRYRVFIDILRNKGMLPQCALLRRP